MTDWRKLFAATESHSLEYFPPQVQDGVVTIAPPEVVLTEGARDWEFAVVAQFLGKPPNFSSIQRIVNLLWEKKGVVYVTLAGPNLFMFQFASVEIRDWVLENGPWHIHNCLMILRKWEPNLERLAFNDSRMPIWIHLRNVPLELFNRIGLSYVASGVGVPLYMDSIIASRKRLAYAKVCVEVKASSIIPECLNVVLANGLTATVGVSVPWMPARCFHCHKFGHFDKACSQPKVNAGKVVQVWQPKDASGTSQSLIEIDVNESRPDVHTLQPEGALALISSMDDLSANELGSAVANPEGVIESSAGTSSPALCVKSVEKVAASTVTGLLQEINARKMKQLEKRACFGSSSKRLEILNAEIVSSTGKGKVLGSGNRYELLGAGNDEDPNGLWAHLVDNAKVTPKRTRAASKGVAKLLRDINGKKKKHRAKGAKSST